MLPIYDAISVNTNFIHSGSSKPSLMTLIDGNGLIKGEYVVKVFRPIDEEQAANTNKEVYGSILAKNFDLNTPESVLVRVSQKVIDILNKSRKNKLVKGTYFATKYIDNTIDYSPAVIGKIQDWEIEIIFAFDVFIKNLDRRVNKPNLFFKDDSIYLIDHELSFPEPLLDQSFKNMLKSKERYWSFIEKKTDNFERKHLFLDHLRNQNKDRTVNFDTFTEYLRILNTNLLDDDALQLQREGNNIDDFQGIKLYLEEVKEDTDLFIQLLKELIS